VDVIARQGLIGFTCANMQGGGQGVAPWGGRDMRLSTNPMAWGIPTSREPIILDMATSASSEGKVRIKRQPGLQLVRMDAGSAQHGSALGQQPVVAIVVVQLDAPVL